MKKILNFLLVLLLVSCQAQKEKFELNLVKGEMYTQKMISSTSVIQTINGQLFNMNMSINGKTTYKVTGIQDSVYDMEVRFENLSMKMTLPNRIMEFNSDKKNDMDIVSTILGTMINKPFSIKMTKTGKVNKVEDIDMLFSNAFASFPQLTDDQKQQIKSQIMQAYGEKAFQGNLEMSTAVFPGIPVSKGDKWVVKTKLEAGMAANLETTYELKEIEDDYCVLSGVSKIETVDKDAYIQANGMPIKYDMSGTMSSKVKINRKTGWVIESKVNQTIRGTNQIKDNPKMPGGMIIPMTMRNEMTITEK